MPRNIQRPPRLHRLPQRLDYILIPAPHDLSLDSVSEKSPLPAIIVTPSSPSSTKDFSIAFLAPPKKPSLRKRIASYFAQSSDDDYVPSTTPDSPPSSAFSFFKWPGSRAPIALPVSTPPSPTSPDVALYPYSTSYGSCFASPPPRSRVTSRILIFMFVIMTLVLCHMLMHYIASLSEPLPFDSSFGGAGMDSVEHGSGVVYVAAAPDAHWYDKAMWGWQRWFGTGQ